MRWLGFEAETLQLDQPPLCYKAVYLHGTSNPFPRFLPMISHDDRPPSLKNAELLWTAWALVPIVWTLAFRYTRLFTCACATRILAARAASIRERRLFRSARPEVQRQFEGGVWSSKEVWPARHDLSTSYPKNAMAFKCFATARYCGDNHTSFDLDLLPSCFAITSGALSMLGALIVLGQWIQAKRRKQLSRSTLQRDVTTMWTVAELVVAVSYIVAGINFITNKRETSRCDIFETIYKTRCFVTTWFSMSGNIWTSILMIYSGLLLVRCSDVLNLAFKRMPIYNVIAWICPLIIALPLLGTGKLECNRSIMHHSTAISIVSLVVAGPLWVLVTFAIMIIFFIIIRVQLAKHPRIRKEVSTWTYKSQFYIRIKADYIYLMIPILSLPLQVVWKTLFPLLLLFFFLRLWGIVQTFVSILTPSDSNGDCIPWDTYTWHLVLEILVVQTLSSYTFPFCHASTKCQTCTKLGPWLLVFHQPSAWIFCNRIYQHYFYLHTSVTLNKGAIGIIIQVQLSIAMSTNLSV